MNIVIEKKDIYEYQGQNFETSWELAVWIWAQDVGKIIKKATNQFEYSFNGQTLIYTPTFDINGTLVDVKGSHFFKEDGTMQNPFDHTQDELFEARHQCGLNNNVEFWSLKGMERVLQYIEYTYSEEFIPLFKKDIPFPYPILTRGGDLDIIRHFHKSLFDGSRKGCLSPRLAWNDKELILKSALNRLFYVGNCRPATIVQGFNIAKIAPKLSVFKPQLAEKLIKTYLNSYFTIVDPFSGFSGRMIGASNCKRKYHGWDINTDHVRESNEIIEFMHLSSCKVECQDLITAPVHPCTKDIALLTCPPYGGKEHWNEKNDEIEKTCDEWIDLSLEKYPGCGKYVFVIDVTDKYKDKIVEVIKNRSHFGTNEEYVVVL